MRIWIICLGSLLLSSLSLCAFISNVSPDNRASICLFARFSYMLDFTFLTTQFRIRPNQNANKLCTIREGFFHFSFNSMRETLKEYLAWRYVVYATGWDRRALWCSAQSTPNANRCECVCFFMAKTDFPWPVDTICLCNLLVNTCVCCIHIGNEKHSCTSPNPTRTPISAQW